MSTKSASPLKGQIPTLALLLIIAAITLWYFLSGASGYVVSGAPALNAGSAIALLIVGLAAGVLGGMIGTGGCSLMLPIMDDVLKTDPPAMLPAGSADESAHLVDRIQNISC